jgi:hypothetical protein
VAINIDLIADVKGVIKGTDKISDALDEVGDDLKDLGKDGDRLEDKVSKAFKNMAEDARSSGKDIGRHVKAGTEKAGEGLDELSRESASTAKESAASFGSIEDAAGALQEVAANAFAGFGPAGMAAGLVAAAGIGLAVSALTDNADKINENKEKMLDLAQTIRDNGGSLTDADYVRNMEDYGYAIQDTKEWFEIFQDSAVSGFEKLRKLAQDTGLSTQDIFKGGFGDKDDARKTLREVTLQLEDLRAKKESVFNATGSLLDPVDENAIQSLKDTETLIRNNITAQEEAEQAERDRKRAIEGTTEALREDIDALEKRADLMKDSITSDLDYRDGIDTLNAALKENGNTVDVNTTKGRENQRAIIDQANVIEDMAKASLEAGTPIADVTAKFNAQKDTLINQVAPAFGGSKEAARKYIEQILKVPPLTKTDVQLNGVAAAEAQLRAFINQPREIPMHISPQGQAVENYINGLNGRRVYIDVAPKNGIAITN